VPTPDENAVFINIPYKKGKYERIFVSIIASIIAIGRKPHCTIEIPEGGQGRLERISELLESCRISIHDLSYIMTPVRFNMPFELGLACALARHRGQHDYVIFDSEPYRLDRYLSDIKGRDPYIHQGTMFGAVKCVLDALSRPELQPEINRVYKMAVDLFQDAKIIKSNNRMDTIFNRTAFHRIVLVGVDYAVQRGFIPEIAEC